MSKWEHFVGATLIFSTVMAFVGVAGDFAEKHPGTLGLIGAILILFNAVLVCRSIWRDRL